MNSEQMFALIGQRAEEVAKRPDVQEKAMRIAREKGKEASMQFIYTVAIATLYGVS